MSPQGSLKVLSDSPSSSSISETTSNRRILIPLSTLRSRSIQAGDWLIITVATNSQYEDAEETTVKAGKKDIQRTVIAQAWPSATLSNDTVNLSPSHSLSLGHPKEILMRKAGARDGWPIAKSVEVTVLKDNDTTRSGNATSGEGKEREQVWETGVLKELLLDLTHITSSTSLTLPTSGNQSYRIRNVVASTIAAAAPGVSRGSVDIAPRKSQTALKENGDGLAKQLRGLEIGDGPQNGNENKQDVEIWTMHWKTNVVIVMAKENESSTGQNLQDSTRQRKIPASSTPATGLNSSIPSYIQIIPPNPVTSTQQTNTETAYSTLGGLSAQISEIRSLLELPLSHPEIYHKFGLKPPRGILLHGPPGTGKTHLARAISASTPGCSCIIVNGPELSGSFHGETEERLRAVWEEARRREPCLVVLDEVDALAPRRDEGAGGGGGGGGGEVEKRVVATLLTLMDGMGLQESKDGEEIKPERVIVIAATNRPNALDPALRRPGRFDREIEIGIPSAPARLEILKILISKMPNDVSVEDLAIIAGKTHGYVGADLSSLMREAGSLAIRRWLDTSPMATPPTTTLPPTSPILSVLDLQSSLPSIRPSAMREVFIETPTVHWTDIGGQQLVQQKLTECVEWPLLHGETFKRLGVEPPRGVLLYGPPGCSKTLTAKALATESGVNFLAVKGPELLNKFVGESERAVREIFRKARAASPAIIFFDEIDALATSRDNSDHTDGVLTTLLNEMDGVEGMSGVIVVAATNRPDVLDSALLRPGRLDRILYVGPPNDAAREDIFKIRLSKMSVEDGVDVAELSGMTVGCSGAELASICQDAALAAMNEDVKAEKVLKRHLYEAAKNVRRRITREMILGYEKWRDQSGAQAV